MAPSESEMPIYEYRCSVCAHEFEAIRGVKADNPTCPKCESSTEKKISLSAFHLKGGGWYSDAYAGSDNKAPGTTAASDDGGSTASDGASSTASAADD